MTISGSGVSNPRKLEENHPPKKQSTALQYLLAFVFFVVFSGAAVWIVIRLRANFIQIITFLQISKNSLLGAINLGTFILMAAGLVGVAWVQNYLFKGIPLGSFWKRTLRILLIEIILAGVSMVFTLIMRLLVL